MWKRNFTVFAVCIVTLLGVVGCYNEEDVVAENEAIASSIIVAIEFYEQTYGAYPNTLDELSPEFLDQIPLTVDGYEFDYRPYPSFGYDLGFGLRNIFGGTYTGCGYLPEYKVWECGSGVE
jgi:hypothetical protein